MSEQTGYIELTLGLNGQYHTIQDGPLLFPPDLFISLTCYVVPKYLFRSEGI
jgi:hypothetical protein